VVSRSSDDRGALTGDRAGLPPTVSPSPLPRTADFQLPPHHPHARKQSVLDGQAQLSEVPAPPPPPALASSSSSSFSLALDPIAESPVTPYVGSPSPRSPPLNGALRHPPALKRDSTRSAQPSGKSPHLNLGHGPPPASGPGPRLRPSTTELILYSYAQLLGTVSITPLAGVSMSQEHAKALNGLRMRLLKRPIVGGGSMDITSRQRVPERRRTHSRASSLTSGLLSLISPLSSASVPPSPIASSALPPWKTGSSRGGAASTNGDSQEDVDPEMPLPTFEVPPSMLAVDLSLAPGESRTCECPRKGIAF